MPTGLQSNLEQALNALAASRGLPSVAVVLTKAESAKPEMGKVLPFTREPRLWWVGRD